jgi:hypothetical protein
MSFRPPLTAEKLRAVSARYEPLPGRAPSSFPESSVWPDILTLLFEIKRMRSLLLRADQLKGGFKAPTMALDSVLDEFLENLEKEPCVREWRTSKEEMLEPSARKVKPNA